MEIVITLSLLCFVVLGLWLQEKNQHENTRSRMNNENYKWQGESDKWHTCYLTQRDHNRRLVDKFIIPSETNKRPMETHPRNPLTR